MAEPFKNLIDPLLVRRMAGHLRRAWPKFDAERFESLALDGLAGLEMKARAMHLCTALEQTLPKDFGRAARMIEAALAPPWPDERLGSADPGRDGLEGWALWPVGEFVARHGIDLPDLGLTVLHALTQRFSAEFAIRPFIDRHPDLTLATLQRWTQDPSAHVRRLCSEGSRPRLPWGLQLKALIADPSPTLPILLALLDDPSPYVRRSVANHLNDIAKDHPALVADWVEQHLPGASSERAALLRHACRTLVKKGDVRVLEAFGIGRPLRGEVGLTVRPKSVAIGDTLTLEVRLRSGARKTQQLAIDYAVHHVKANGQRTPKVFKGWLLELAAGEERCLVKRHSMRRVTTRSYHPGRHAVDLRVNGRIAGHAEFNLTSA